MNLRGKRKKIFSSSTLPTALKPIGLSQFLTHNLLESYSCIVHGLPQNSTFTKPNSLSVSQSIFLFSPLLSHSCLSSMHLINWAKLISHLLCAVHCSSHCTYNDKQARQGPALWSLHFCGERDDSEEIILPSGNRQAMKKVKEWERV